MNTIIKFFAFLITTISILFTVWVTISYVDIIADNKSPNPTHSDYNFFIVVTEYFDGGDFQ